MKKYWLQDVEPNNNPQLPYTMVINGPGGSRNYNTCGKDLQHAIEKAHKLIKRLNKPVDWKINYSLVDSEEL